MLASWTTDVVGIYSIFGGFIFGVAMPHRFLVQEFRKQLEPIIVVFLLPLFFTLSGLNNRLDTVNNSQRLSFLQPSQEKELRIEPQLELTEKIVGRLLLWECS